MAAPMKEKDYEALQNSKEVQITTSNRKIKEILFFTGLAGISLLGGFSAAISRVKKKEPELFYKGLAGVEDAIAGSTMGPRALMIATALSVGGVGLIFLAAFKFSGAKNLQDFGTNMKEKTPQFPKKESTGRNEFKNLTELFRYIIDGEDDKK